MTDMHAKAIEAACIARFGDRPWYGSINMHGADAKHIEEHRQEMRRAIAAFLREEHAAFQILLDGIVGELPTGYITIRAYLRKTADELDGGRT